MAMSLTDAMCPMRALLRACKSHMPKRLRCQGWRSSGAPSRIPPPGIVMSDLLGIGRRAVREALNELEG
jgi:hypothetical protein